MADGSWESRRDQLAKVAEDAVRALAEHLGTHLDSWKLYESQIARVGTQSVLEDRNRLQAIESLRITLGPGDDFGEDVPWVASFEEGGFAAVFGGETLREALDNAIRDANSRYGASQPS